MTNAIAEFQDEHRYLSNFWPGPVLYQPPLMHSRMWFRTAEHAYQVAKCANPSEARSILDAPTPGQAKRLGQHVVLADNWDQHKKQIMLHVLLAKFTQDVELRLRLTGTAPRMLIEGNHWHDNYWGQCFCDRCDPFAGHKQVLAADRPDAIYAHPGKNYLGRILMAVRDVLE
jgi:ribA/ribD-fused uncharacterized protein